MSWTRWMMWELNVKVNICNLPMSLLSLFSPSQETLCVSREASPCLGTWCAVGSWATPSGIWECPFSQDWWVEAYSFSPSVPLSFYPSAPLSFSLPVLFSLSCLPFSFSLLFSLCPSIFMSCPSASYILTLPWFLPFPPSLPFSRSSFLRSSALLRCTLSQVLCCVKAEQSRGSTETPPLMLGRLTGFCCVCLRGRGHPSFYLRRLFEKGLHVFSLLSAHVCCYYTGQ